MTDIRQLQDDDIDEFRQLVRLFGEVFEMKDFRLPDDGHLKTVLAGKGFVVFVTMEGDTVIGGLTAHILPSYYSSFSEVFIYDIAVHPSRQRQGNGKQLLAALNSYCRGNNYKEVFVLSDEADIHALDFYRSAGGSAQKVVSFSFLSI